MIQPPDHMTHKRLVLVKQLYNHALADAAITYSHSHRIMAVIGFDLAVETIAKAVFFAFNPNPKERPPSELAELAYRNKGDGKSGSSTQGPSGDPMV